jgi:lysophospholipase L1-like esterase
MGEAESINSLQNKRVAVIGDCNFYEVVAPIIGAKVQAANIIDYTISNGYLTTYSGRYWAICDYIGAMPVSTFDVIIICLGFNDLSAFSGTPVLGSCWTPATGGRTLNLNTTEVSGATNYVLGSLRERNPNLRIIWCSNTKTSNELLENDGMYISQLNDTIKNCCEENSVPFIDSYSISGINSLGTNHSKYYKTSYDYLNTAGKTKLADFLSQQLMCLI